MKHFIYLNTDVLNSYLSQINDGIVNKVKSEVYDEVKKTSNETITTKENKFEGGFKVPGIFDMKFTETPEGIKTTNALTQLEYGKELIEKMLHDNALQQFIKCIDLNTLNNCSVGDYVKFSGDYTLTDIDYFLSVYTDEFIEFLAEKAGENTTKPAIKNKLINNERSSQKNVRKIFTIAKTILPTSKFVSCNDCFIPLTDKYLRESTKSIRFNHTGNITIIGKYISTIDKSVSISSKEKSSFGKLFSSIDNVNKTFYIESFGIPLDNKVIMPIALYFE